MRTILLGIALVAKSLDGLSIQDGLRPESLEHLLRVIEASALLHQVEQRAIPKLKQGTTPGILPILPSDEEGPEMIPATPSPPEEELAPAEDASLSTKQILRRLQSALPPESLRDLEADILAALGRLRGTTKMERARDEPECFLLAVIDEAFARDLGEEDCASASIKWLAARSQKKAYQTFAAMPEARTEIFEAFRQGLRHRGPRDLKEPAVAQGILDTAFFNCLKSDALRRRLTGHILGAKGEVEFEEAPRSARTLQEFVRGVKGAYANVKRLYPGLSAPVRDVVAMRRPSSAEPADELVRAYQTERTAAIGALCAAVGPHLDEEERARLEAIFSSLPLSDLEMYRSNSRALMCKIIYSTYPALTNGHDLLDCRMAVISNLQRRATSPSDRAILDDELLGADVIFDGFVAWIKQSHLGQEELKLSNIEEAIYKKVLNNDQDSLERIANAIWEEAAVRDQYPTDRVVPRDVPTYSAFCDQVRDRLQEMSAFDASNIPPAAQIDVSKLSVGERRATFEKLAHQGPLVFTLERMGHPLGDQLHDRTASEQNQIIYDFYAPRLPEDSPESAAFASKRNQLATLFKDWVLNQSTVEPNFELAAIAPDLALCTAQEARPLVESLPPPLRDNSQAVLAIRKLSREQLHQLASASPEIRECFAAVLGGHPSTFPVLDEFASAECRPRLLEAIRHHPLDADFVLGGALQRCLADPRLEASLYTSILRWSVHAANASRLDPSRLEILLSAEDRKVALDHLKQQFWEQQKKVLFSPAENVAVASAASLQDLFSAVESLFVPIVTAVEGLYPRSLTVPVDLTPDQLWTLYHELVQPDGAFSVALRTLNGEADAQKFVTAPPQGQLDMLLQKELNSQPSLHALYKAYEGEVLAFHQKWVVGNVPGPRGDFATDLYTHLTGEALVDKYSTVFITQVANPATVAASYGAFIGASDRTATGAFSDYVFARISGHTKIGRRVLRKIDPNLLVAAPGLGGARLALEFTPAHTVSSYCQELASRYAAARSLGEKIAHILNAAMGDPAAGIPPYNRAAQAKVRGALSRLSLDQLCALEDTPQAARLFALVKTQRWAFSKVDLADPKTYEEQIKQSLAAFLATDPLADHLAKQASPDPDQLITALLIAARISGHERLRPMGILSVIYNMVKDKPANRQQFATAIEEYLLGREGLYRHPDPEDAESNVPEDLSLAQLVARVKSQGVSIHALVQERLPSDLDQNILAGKDSQELVRIYLELLDAEKRHQAQLEAARTEALGKIPSTRYPATAREQIKTLIQGLDLEELQRLIGDGEGFECLLLQHAMPELSSDPTADCQASLQAGLLNSINRLPPPLASFAAALTHPPDGAVSGASLYTALRSECSEHGHEASPDVNIIFNRAYSTAKQDPTSRARIQTALAKVLVESREVVFDPRAISIDLESTLLQDVQQMERQAKTANDLLPEIVAAMPAWLAPTTEAHIKDLPLEQLLALKTQVQSDRRGVIDLATRVRLGALWHEISTLPPDQQIEGIRSYINAQMVDATDQARKVIVEALPDRIRQLFDQWALDEGTQNESLETYVYIELTNPHPQLAALAHFYGLTYFKYENLALWLLRQSSETLKEIEKAPAEVKYCAAIQATNPALFGPASGPPYKFSPTDCLQVLYSSVEAALTSNQLSIDPRHIRHYASGIWQHLDNNARSQLLPLLLRPLASTSNLSEKWLDLLANFYTTGRAAVHAALSKTITEEGLLNADDFASAIGKIGLGTGTFNEDLESILSDVAETPKGWVVSVAPSHMREMAYSLATEEAAVVKGALSGVSENFEYRLAIELLARRIPIFEGFADKAVGEQCSIVNLYALQAPEWICNGKFLPSFVVRHFRLYIESHPPDSLGPIPQHIFEGILRENRSAATKLLVAKIHPQIVKTHQVQLENSASKISSADMLRLFTDNLELQAFVVGALNLSIYGDVGPGHYSTPEGFESRFIARRIADVGDSRIPEDFKRSSSKLISAVYDWMGKSPRLAKMFIQHLRDGKIPFVNVNAKR